MSNNVQVINQKEDVFENCHFYTDSKMANYGGTSVIYLAGNMKFIGCHFEETVDIYVDSSWSGTVEFIDCTYGNNGVEDRPFEPTIGFFTWWMEPTNIALYQGTFGEGDPGRTNFTCIVDGTTVWEATN